MNVPHQLRDVDDAAIVRTHEYDDGTEITVDFGTATETAVDVVDDTAILVVDGQQFEFELPPDASEVVANNGVLTIFE